MLGLSEPDGKRVMHVHVKHKSSSPKGQCRKSNPNPRIWSLKKTVISNRDSAKHLIECMQWHWPMVETNQIMLLMPTDYQAMV